MSRAFGILAHETSAAISNYFQCQPVHIYLRFQRVDCCYFSFVVWQTYQSIHVERQLVHTTFSSPVGLILIEPSDSSN